MLVAQGKLDEALKAYRDGLAIAERLAEADRSNADGSAIFGFLRQGRRRAGGAQGNSTRRLRPTTTASPSASGWPPPTRQHRVAARPLGRLLHKVGDVLEAQGKLDEALKTYRDGLDDYGAR